MNIFPLPHISTRHVMAAVLLSVCCALLAPASTAQSAWSNPFESPSNEQQDDEPRSPWDARTQDRDDSDPWNTDDPWGLEERDNIYGDSDWARDFYDFEDENGGSSTDGSARRVGDGVAMNAVTCNRNIDCGGRVCCTDEDGNTSCGSAGNDPCGNGPSDPGDPVEVGDDEFVDDEGNTRDISDCQGGGPYPPYCGSVCGDGDTGDCAEVAPLPGLVYLLLAGLGYGGYKLREQQADA